MALPLPSPSTYDNWQVWGATLIRALRGDGTEDTTVEISKRLFGPALLTNAAGTKYTVPAKARATIKHLHVQNPSGSPVNFTMSIGADVAGARVFDAFPVPAASYLSLPVLFILEAGEIIQAFGGTTNILTLTLNGEVVAL